MACVLFALLMVSPCISQAKTIDVQIKGIDDGVKTTKQQDFKEAVLFAKRQAIERAGVKVRSLTTAKDFVIHSDYIESKAEAVLLPGYNILDIGYQQDGTYLIILAGKVKTSTSNSIRREVPRSIKKKVPQEGHFIKHPSGVVHDKKTGLEWYAGPDRATNWNEAKEWVENLNVAGGSWRMPTREELRTLYKNGAGVRNMTPLLKTTGWGVWSGETRDSSSAWGFDFSQGLERWFSQDISYNERGFAVRSRK
ncbi:MAG: DUF1566 domain-containing protein [Desulfobacterales bacterium]|nr:MAG: DUF1566 domain-containing protein [Desulfobacterales bacterium]